MNLITKYSVIQCDLYAIQTGLLHLSQSVKSGFVAVDFNRDSAFFELFGPAVESGDIVTINESEFVDRFRQEFVKRGMRTAVLNGEPNVVVVYYGDDQNRTVQKVVDANRMSVKYTSYLSPKQAAMII